VGTNYDSHKDGNGEWQFIQEGTGLVVIDIWKGTIIGRLETQATGIRITADGAYLLLSGWDDSGWTEVVEAQTLERIAFIDQQDVIVTQRVDGQPVILTSQFRGNQSGFALLDPQTFEVTHRWTVTGRAWPVVP
jgi:hypothetical protein